MKGRLAAQEKKAKEIPETVQESAEPALAGRLDPHSREVWELYLDDISDRDLELLNRFYDSIAQDIKTLPAEPTPPCTRSPAGVYYSADAVWRTIRTAKRNTRT